MPFPLNFDVYNVTPQRMLITACVALILLAAIQIRVQKKVPKKRIVATVLSAIATVGVYITLVVMAHTAPAQQLAFALVPVTLVAALGLFGSLRKQLWMQATLYMVAGALNTAIVFALYLTANIFDHSTTWMGGPINVALYIACAGSWVFVIGLPVTFVAWLIKAMIAARRARKAAANPPVSTKDADDED